MQKYVQNIQIYARIVNTYRIEKLKYSCHCKMRINKIILFYLIFNLTLSMSSDSNCQFIPSSIIFIQNYIVKSIKILKNKLILPKSDTNTLTRRKK